jgi:GNAT superfamily N-acetyltransferase
MTYEIRPAAAPDVPVVADLIRQLARYEKLEQEVKMTEEVLATALYGPRPFAEAVLVEEDGRAIGFALFFHNFSTFLGRPGIYLEDLFVVPEHRGRGVGRALLKHLANLAVERDCGRLEWAVLNWNRDAVGFYESLGARPNSEWTVYRLTGEALGRLGRE